VVHLLGDPGNEIAGSQQQDVVLYLGKSLQKGGLEGELAGVHCRLLAHHVVLDRFKGVRLSPDCLFALSLASPRCRPLDYARQFLLGVPHDEIFEHQLL
jgi:hypothetical protein